MESDGPAGERPTVFYRILASCKGHGKENDVLSIQGKAKKLLTVLPKGEYLYKLAEAVAVFKSEVGHNAAKMIERAYGKYFRKGIDR